MTSGRVELAVLGAGVMGSNHVRVARGLRDAVVRIVSDPDEDRGRALAASAGAEYIRDPARAVESADAVIVAAPTSAHESLALAAIGAGRPVLVEKPLAPSPEVAERIVDAARGRQVPLMVGHVERFNPVVLELDHHRDGLRHVDATRLSPFNPRVADDVVSDLMIHDLDILLALRDEKIAVVEAVGGSHRTDRLDVVAAIVGFESGTTASLTASRIAQDKIRALRLTLDDRVVECDLVRQVLTVHRMSQSEFLSEAGIRYRQSGVVEIPFLEHRGEPLYLELEHFVGCVIDNLTPRTSGESALRTLRLVERVSQAALKRTSKN